MTARLPAPSPPETEGDAHPGLAQIGSERRITALATLPGSADQPVMSVAGGAAARVAAGGRRSLLRVYGQALAAGYVYTVAGTGMSGTRR